jgi:toxin ParE1/3/4
VREFGEEQAENYFNGFFERFAMLAEQPLAYPAVDDIRDGYRRSVYGTDSIYYRVAGDNIEIMAIIGQQDLDVWL